MFVDVIDAKGATKESFLMTTYLGNKSGMIVPSDVVLEFPNKYLTSELARKVNCVYPEEIEQFGLSSLIAAVRRQYPDIKSRD